MSSLLIPFANTASGDVVQPDKAHSGVALTCPGCDGEVRFRQRNGARDHFYHLNRPESPTACGETAIHRVAKAIVTEQDSLDLIWLSVWDPLTGQLVEKIRPQTRYQVTETIEEYAFPGGERVADVLVTGIDPEDPAIGHQLAIEITVSNPVRADRRAWYRKNDIPCIEIELYALSDLPTMDDIREAVLDVMRQRWIHHPAAAVRLERLRAANETQELLHHPTAGIEDEGPLDEDREFRRPALLEWFESNLPASMAAKRESYWEHYTYRLLANKESLTEALKYCPTDWYDKLISQYILSGPGELIDQLATKAPFILADKDGLEWIARMITPDDWLELPKIDAADVIWIMKSTVSIAQVVPHLITTGKICLANSFREGERIPLPKLSMFNKAQRQHEEWLTQQTGGVDTITRLVYCARCRNTRKIAEEFRMNMPRETRCSCGTKIPIRY